MPMHPWGISTPEMNAGVLESGSTAATWATASASWMGLSTATLIAMGIVGAQMQASLTSMSGIRSMVHSAATPPFMTWLAGMAGIAFKQAAIDAVVAESYGMARTTMIPSAQSIRNRMSEMAAEASNVFGQNTPLIAELNAEYGVYTVSNASIGNTYGEVITAATMPVPIPPPPPLGSAANAASDAADAANQSAQLVSQAGSGALSQAAGQSTGAASQGASSSTDMLSSMSGQMSQMFQAPMQALQGAGSSLSSPFQSLTQMFQGSGSMFGSPSGMGNLLGGGSTGESFSPASKFGGLPLGAAGLGGGGASLGGGGGGLGGYGGLSGAGKATAVSSNSRTSVLSGVSNVEQERLAGAPASSFGNGGGMPPAAAAGNREQSRKAESATAVLSRAGKGDESLRRQATGNERELFT